METPVLVAIVAGAALFGGIAHAEEKEPLAVFEFGFAANLPNIPSYGPTVAVEFTPIKDWLEIEIGTGPFFGAGPIDWSTDVLFKKPYDLSDTAEMMVGAGPAFDSAFGGRTMIGAEFAVDFMFWPWPDRKYGWFLEPSYTYDFINGRAQAFGISAGLLVAIR